MAVETDVMRGWEPDNHRINVWQIWLQGVKIVKGGKISNSIKQLRCVLNIYFIIYSII